MAAPWMPALKKAGQLAARELPQQFKEAYDSYVALCCEAGYSASGTYTRLNRIKRMLLFSTSMRYQACRVLPPGGYRSFSAHKLSWIVRTVATMLTASRVFFRHLYQKGFTQEDLSQKVPVVKANRKFRLPRT